MVDDIGMIGVAPTLADGPRAQSPCAPRLRLLPKGAGARSRDDAARPQLSRTSILDERHTASASVEEAAADAPLLVAGRDPLRRAEVLHDLSETMPAGTRFEELGALWEVLAWAPASRAVILSGELDDVPAESLLHTLGHRHPGLPVVSVEATAAGLR
jgi:hypothetical protein